MAKTDYYTTLEIERNASVEDIKKAFKRLALKYHPDKQQGKSEAEKKAAEEKFKEINEAYSVLSDPQKKQQYDRFGTVGDMGMGAGPDFGDSDLSDLIRGMHSGFGRMKYGFDIFGDEDNMQRQKQVIKGGNVNIRIEYTLEDAYNGAKKTVKYHRLGKCHHCDGKGSKNGTATTCPHCNGTGMMKEVHRLSPFQTVENISTCTYCGGTGTMISDPCKHCNGSGLEQTTETITVDIPKGIVNGSVGTIPGMGHLPTRGDGIPGDLNVKYQLKQHEIFAQLPGTYDLGCKTTVSVIDCILGCEKEIKCIDGTKVKIKIPQGTKHNDKLSVARKGMPINGGYGYGNMIVFINQEMPKTLSKDEIKTLEELRKSKNFKN